MLGSYSDHLLPVGLFNSLPRLDVYAKKRGRKMEQHEGGRQWVRVEFNRGFYLAPCCESINSKTTRLIDIIDSNNVPLYILWHYFSASHLSVVLYNSGTTSSQLDTDAVPVLELMKKFLIN